MSKRFYTILILPDATSTAQKLHLKRSSLMLVVAGLAVAALALGGFAVRYATGMIELTRLREQARDHGRLSARMGQLEAELARLRQLDEGLRDAAGLDRAPAAPAVAQGGAEAETRAALLDAVQERDALRGEGLDRNLQALGREIVSREQSMRELKQYLERKHSVFTATPTIVPVRGMVTAGYGYRRSPFTGQRELHEGLDIAAPHGTPVLAAAAGIVGFVGPFAGYGNVVVVNHGHGLSTFYAHNSRARVKEGQVVRRGDILAHVGTSGRTTGPHVHFEVHVKGSAVNPLRYVADRSALKFAGEAQAAAR